MLTSDIRKSFLNFFEGYGHKIVGSSSVVPQNDPSLLFTNAGMVPFKNIFTGVETRDYTMAVSSQKCIRAGGKHNDLDQVGFTARHHTFFEMLGNFSFGDYFKEDAIWFAWTFLTKELGISKSRLLVTVYHDDDEAKSIWKKVAGDHINVIPIATSDNFWSMGATGPCGPCSEIFYDHGENVHGGVPGSADENGDRFVEIWNVVFMQFEQLQNGDMQSLKRQSIDTGMGLERISSVMQGVCDNYQADGFKYLIDAIKKISKTNFDNIYPSYKVIADHIRSISFLIGDGVVPSNEGRGYVLRRILRRAMRHGNMIGIKNPFLCDLATNLITFMKNTYPELENAEHMIVSTIKNEEEKFLDTLDRGLKILRTSINAISSNKILSGEEAFKLYDTYGFPLDLTQDILKAEGITVDTNGFETALTQQKNRAKWKGSGSPVENAIWRNLKEKFGESSFDGYSKESMDSKIIAIIQRNEAIDTLACGRAYCVTQATAFYAECGGQVGDTGTIQTETGVFNVENTLKFCDGIIAHDGVITSGYLSVGADAFMMIDHERRKKIMANHTATHLLHAALKHVLGNHVVQRGSFLDDARLRFDFSHNVTVSIHDIENVEEIVNTWILENFDVNCINMQKNEAINLGATALFGEKYADLVRTVKVDAVSFELCGGLHVAKTGSIGAFKILSESSIGSGIRRIEAITGNSVLYQLRYYEKLIKELSENLKCIPSEILQKTSEIQENLKQKNHEVLNNKQKDAMDNLRIDEKKGVHIYSTIVSNFTVADLRSLNDFIRTKKTSGIVVLFNHDNDKISLIISVSDDLCLQFNAGKLLQAIVPLINGKGGGSASFAQGGGTGKNNILASIQKLVDFI